MRREFSLDSLKHLDEGRIVEAWNQAIARAVSDCDDRPGVIKPRKIVLSLELTPSLDEDGDMASVRGRFEVKEAHPQRKSKLYDFMPVKGGMLAFNDMSTDNASQRTIDELIPEDGAE